MLEITANAPCTACASALRYPANIVSSYKAHPSAQYIAMLGKSIFKKFEYVASEGEHMTRNGLKYDCRMSLLTSPIPKIKSSLIKLEIDVAKPMPNNGSSR